MKTSGLLCLVVRICHRVYLLLFPLLFLSAAEGADFTPFGPNGEGGKINGQDFNLRDGAEVFQVDAFIRIEGMDLNGSALGTAAQLSTSAALRSDPYQPRIPISLTPSA